jgi:hypothetical protein
LRDSVGVLHLLALNEKALLSMDHAVPTIQTNRCLVMTRSFQTRFELLDLFLLFLDGLNQEGSKAAIL